MRFDYYETVCIISVVLLSLLSVFLLTHREGKKLSNRILAVFLIAQLFAIIDLLLNRMSEYTYIHLPYLIYMGYPFRYLWAPTLFIYTKSLTSADYRLTPKRLLHALPFVFFACFVLFGFHIHSSETKQFLLNRSYLALRIEGYLMYLLLHTQILCYITASLVALHKYRKSIKMVYSSLARVNLSWLKLILYGYTLSWFSSLLVVYQILASRQFIGFLDEINITAFLLFFNIIVYKGLTQPKIFLDPEGVKRNQNQQPLPESKIESYNEKLSDHMKDNKPYLNCELTIKELAEELSIPSRHLSLVINEKLNKNFFDFISDYRIAEAKQMLSDPAFQNMSILEILYDAGFNSKSSFNSLFKKKTGMTPSEFRKNNTNG